MKPDEKGQSPDIAFFVFVLMALIIFGMDLSEVAGLDDILGENPELTALMIAAGVALVGSVLIYLKRSEHKVTPTGMTFPAEIKWRENLGNRIKETKAIAALISFLIAALFMGRNAFYLAFAVYAGLRFTQYLFLNPKREILKDALAIIMIVVFLVIVIIWAKVDIFFPAGAVLFVIFFLLLFMYLFWGGGLDNRF